MGGGGGGDGGEGPKKHIDSMLEELVDRYSHFVWGERAVNMNEVKGLWYSSTI